MIRLLFILVFIFAHIGTNQTTAINMNNSWNQNLLGSDLTKPGNNGTHRIYNNPGNLRCIKTSDFRIFNTLEEGYKALLHDLNLKISGKSPWTDSTTTIYDFIAIYAPAIENNINTCVEMFCSETGLQATDLLSTQQIELIARGIIKIENSDLYHQLYASK